LKAQSDEAIAAAEFYPDRADALRHEAERCARVAVSLEQRLGMLLAEQHQPMTGTPGANGQNATPKKPWQRPEWWEQLKALEGGLAALLRCAEAHAEEFGTVGVAEVQRCHGIVHGLSDLKPKTPEVLAVQPVEPLLCLREIPEKLRPIKWDVVDVDAQSGVQLMLMAQQVSLGMPALEVQPVSTRAADCLRTMATLIEAMGSHAELPRLKSAQQALMDGRYNSASTVLAGIAPPNPLRYELTRLAHQIAALGVA
jgi:hypothetical protein